MVSAFDDAFNVTWEDPKDAESIWAIDRIHFAHPVAPLAEELYRRIIERSWATPCVFVNGYAYLKDFAPPPTPQEVIERGAATVWREDYLPRVKQLCSDLRERDYDSMSAPDLVDQLPQLFDESAEAFKYPTVVASAFMGPGLMLAAFCEREIGPDGPVLVASLLQGFANDSIAAGMSLGELASFAQSRPEVAAALRERRYDDIPSLPGGDEFMASLGAYLDTYGWRAEEWSLVHRPTWTEDPKTPLFLISRYVEDPARSPAESMRRAVEQREAAEREIESRLPEDKRPEFRKMLEAAHRHVQVSEERALWQLIAIGSVRVPVLALGRELVEAGALDQPDDAFYLTLEELRRIAATPEPTHALVAQRRAEQDRREAMHPPASIGRPLVVADRPPQSQIVHRFFFGTTLEPGEGKQLKGTGASRGVVTGPARVIRSLSESDALQAGEILVCRNTAPPWTPLFAIAAAVVTDIGGLLSHSAICAREYAIPCVVGTGTATTRIATGDLITVDGAAGTVTIE